MNYKKIPALVLLFFITFAATTAFAQTPVNAPVGTHLSANWAGYVAASDSKYTAVKGSWVVPTSSASNNSSSAEATWVGIGGVSSRDLIQAGTETIIENGEVSYVAWYELLPRTQQPIPLTVHAGDSVTVSLNETSTNTWQLVFTNNTTGKKYEKTLDYTSSHSSAEWIEEMPTMLSRRGAGYVPLSNFGTVTFTNAYATVDGVQKSMSSTGAKPLTMMGRTEVLATPSALLADTSFSVSRSSVANEPTLAERPTYRTSSHRGGSRWFIIRFEM